MVQVNKNKKGKFILIGLAVTALGVGGYFAYQHFGKKSQKNRNADFFDDSEQKIASAKKALPPAPSMRPRPKVVYRSAPSSSGFPLKWGSKGALVKQLQEALMKKYGAQILPKWKADADFGTETRNALSSKGLPTVIDRSTFNSIVGGKSSKPKSTHKPSKPSLSRDQYAKVLSKRFKTAMKNNDLNYALKNLGYIKTFSFYMLIHNDFKREAPEGHWTRKGIYDALTGQFSDSGSLRQLRKQFKRIGLNRPELNGVRSGGGKLMTLTETKIWNEGGESIWVPAKTILGDFIRGANGETEFNTIDGKRLLVSTRAIKYVIV